MGQMIDVESSQSSITGIAFYQSNNLDPIGGYATCYDEFETIIEQADMNGSMTLIFALIYNTETNSYVSNLQEMNGVTPPARDSALCNIVVTLSYPYNEV